MWLGSGVAVLWYRPMATAPTGPLAWEPPYAAGAALEKTKRKIHVRVLTGVPTVVQWDL